MPGITVQDLIRQEATKAGIPPELALAVAEQESSFNPTAIGPQLDTGESAVGTFQLLPSTAKRLGIDPRDPVQNIQGGAKYLRELMDRHQGNLDAVLKEYGGVKTDQKYVPGVMERIGKFRSTPVQSPPSQAPPTPQAFTNPKARMGQAALGLLGLDPMTESGRQNLAGAAAAAGTLALTKNVNAASRIGRLVQIGAPIAGAFAGGAAENAAEQVAGPPSPLSLQGMLEAGKTQAGYEAAGQMVAWPVKAIGRRVMASGVGKKVTQGLSDALDAVNARLQTHRPAVSPSQAGELADKAIQGPAKSVKDLLGETVAETAAKGPMVKADPLRAKLADLAQQITPMASHQQGQFPPQMVMGRMQTPAQLAALKQQFPTLALSTLPPDHPLPAALDTIREAIGDQPEIPFAEAHKIKTLLDSVVDWERSAKRPPEQISKAFRQTLRSEMSGHAPYEQATADYGTVARLFKGVKADQLHAHLLDNPGAVVSRIKWQNPASAGLVKEITGLATDTKGLQQGEAAWNAVRAAWTQEHLIAKGAKGLRNEMRKIESSNAGQEFIQTMYGDPQGQIVWKNLQQIGDSLEQVLGAKAAFKESSIATASSPAQAVRDIAYAVTPGRQITKEGAISRLVFGPAVKDFIQWSSYTPARTQFLIKHVLTGADPGMALADMARWWMGAEQPMASHDQGPPTPQAVRR